jgi:hypothetical protein
MGETRTTTSTTNFSLNTSSYEYTFKHYYLLYIPPVYDVTIQEMTHSFKMTICNSNSCNEEKTTTENAKRAKSNKNRERIKISLGKYSKYWILLRTLIQSQDLLCRVSIIVNSQNKRCFE